MRVALSVTELPVPGWATLQVDHELERLNQYLDAHEGQIEEILVLQCVERMPRSEARRLCELLAPQARAGVQVRFVVPDAGSAFAALDEERVSSSAVEEWVDHAFPAGTDPWCVSPAALETVAVEANLGHLVREEIPIGLPPAFGEWYAACRVEIGAERADRVTVEPRSLQRRVGDLSVRRILSDAAAEEHVATDAPARSPLRQLLDRYLPSGGRRRAVARAGLDVVRESERFVERIREISAQSGLHEPRTPSYHRWLAQHRATSKELDQQRRIGARAREPIGIQFVIIDGTPGDLRTTLRSLEAQTWPHWRATVMAHRLPFGSTDPRVVLLDPSRPLVDAYAHEAASPRDLVVFMRAGDRLEPDAAFWIADTAFTNPFVDVVYWDDDERTGTGSRNPRFKPEWSPEMLLSANYIGRSFAIRNRAVPEPNSSLGDDTWWDLLLRARLEPHRVVRVPRVLSHLQRRPAPVGRHGLEVVRSHLEREGLPAEAVSSGDAIRLVWRREDQELPHVTVIIPTRHNTKMLGRSLDDLARTDYPSFDVIVVDNGARSAERDAWYEQFSGRLDLRVEWWDEPFNYSAVNNAAAAQARGDVLVFLNDDTAMPDAGWLRELVGWAIQPEIGLVGLQLLDAEGRIQHGGVIVGLEGFAGHLFQGIEPGTETLIGSTGWYRNVLSVTGACVAVRRDLFEELGGFDERFRLCGSDVALGLDAVLAGKRNLCSPHGRVRHLESATRGTFVPFDDYYTSYWRYQRWIYAGDPYFSPSLSPASTIPRLHSRYERTSAERVGDVIGRSFKVFRQSTDDAEVDRLADLCRVTDHNVEMVNDLHARNAKPFAPKTINWFLPELDSPFYGGINTALRIADHLARVHGVENRFVLWAHPDDGFHRSAISAAFPSLADAPIYYDLSLRASGAIPAADVAIATLWVTAYAVTHFTGARRKFYLVQDFEPMFYPAGTMYALAEESYRLGLYGLCNTDNLLRLYESYGGRGSSFKPAVDRSVFHPEGRHTRRDDDPVTVFVYARPGHWRNCWEIASLALRELKDRLGDRVRVVTAGSWARPEELGGGIEHLGLLDYRETGELYRRCDVGVALTVSEHPSYLPLELMACGVPVVAFDNPAGRWLLHPEENCLVARRTVSDLVRQLERMVVDTNLRQELAARSLRDIDEGYASWDKALSGIYEYLSNPEGLS